MLSSALLVVLAAPAASDPVDSAHKVHPALREAFGETPSAELHRVYAVLDEQLSLYDLLEEKVGRHPRGERQLVVAARLHHRSRVLGY